MIVVLRPCKREISDLLDEIREDLADVLARLDAGHRLSMPLSRPLPVVGRGVHELRLRGKDGNFRVVYGQFRAGEIVVLRAFQKKSQQLPSSEKRIVQRRMREWLV